MFSNKIEKKNEVVLKVYIVRLKTAHLEEKKIYPVKFVDVKSRTNNNFELYNFLFWGEYIK